MVHIDVSAYIMWLTIDWGVTMKMKKKILILLGVILLVIVAIYFLNDRSSSSSRPIESTGTDSGYAQSENQLLEEIIIKDLDDYILYSDVIVTGKVVETSEWYVTYETFYETIVEVDQQFKGQSDEEIYVYHSGDSFETGQEWLLFLNKLDLRLHPRPRHRLVNVVSRGLIEEGMVNNGFRDLTTPISLDELSVKINQSEFIDQPHPFNPQSLKEDEMRALADNPPLDELIAHSDFVYYVKTKSIEVANPDVVYANVDILAKVDLIEGNSNQLANEEANFALPQSIEPDTEYLIFYQNIFDYYDLTTRNGSIISEHDPLWEQALSQLEIEAN